jgi:hypothetical protein
MRSDRGEACVSVGGRVGLGCATDSRNAPRERLAQPLAMAVIKSTRTIKGREQASTLGI